MSACFNPIQPGGGADLPPPSRIRVYTRTYASKHADFFLLFLTFSVEEVAKSFTQKKFTVFPEIQKVGPIWQNFIREYPYEPQKTSKKVTFSDHYFGWFQVSESCKTLCLASILVRYKVPTQFWNLPPINTIFMDWGQICPPPGSFRYQKTPGWIGLTFTKRQLSSIGIFH